jgi:hypothetical protein
MVLAQIVSADGSAIFHELLVEDETRWCVFLLGVSPHLIFMVMLTNFDLLLGEIN